MKRIIGLILGTFVTGIAVIAVVKGHWAALPLVLAGPAVFYLSLRPKQ